MQFTDWFCRHKVCVLYAERLVTGTALFVNLHHEQFVIRQGELGQHEYTPHRGFPVHRYQADRIMYTLYVLTGSMKFSCMAVRLATFLSTTLKRI